MNRQRPEDELDVLLSGGGDNPGLSHALASLRGLGAGPAPVPSAEVSAFFTPKVAPLRPRRRRGVVLSTLVAASMGLGIGTVAAVSPDFRDGLQDAVDHAVVLVQPGSRDQLNNDGGTSAGAPVPVATRDSGAPAGGGPGLTPAPADAEAKDGGDDDRDEDAKDAAEKKAAAKDAKGAPDRAGEEPGRSGGSAANTGIAPGNGLQVPGLAKQPDAIEKVTGRANGLQRRAEPAPEGITVTPPVQVKQAPDQAKQQAQPKEKVQQAPGQLRNTAKKATERVNGNPDGPPGQDR